MRSFALTLTASAAACSNVGAFQCMQTSHLRRIFAASQTTIPRDTSSCFQDHAANSLAAAACATRTSTAPALMQHKCGITPAARSDQNSRPAGRFTTAAYFQRPERYGPRPSSSLPPSRKPRCSSPYCTGGDAGLHEGPREHDNPSAAATGSADLTSSASKSAERADGSGPGTAGERKERDGRALSRLSNRLNDLFPLVSADEMRLLLDPDEKKGKAGSPREDTLAALMHDVRDIVEELMERVGTTEDKALMDLKAITEKFKGVLKGDPATVAELRQEVMKDLEDVKDEIEELLELKQLSKARKRLEKATAESTELVFDSAVTALAKGLDTVIMGKDAMKEGEEVETLQVSTYFYGRENEFWDDMQANGVTPRRFFLYTLLGGGVALGGNLFGVTSGLLGGVAPDASRDARLDVLFPIGGFKRFYAPEEGYEFIYPKQWVGDSGLELRRQRDAEEARAPSSAVMRARQRRTAALSPTVGFGPQGGDGTENVSVVKSELMAGFSLQGTMGEPREAAQKFLSTVIAPENSGREWELIDAFGEERSPGGLVYQFEYRVKGKRIRRPMHNIGLVAARGSTLFTFTVLAPEENWSKERGEKYRRIAQSFRLTF